MERQVVKMYSVMKENNSTQYGLTQYVCDTEADIKSLPTTARPGSTCILIEGARVFMLTVNRQWKELK